MIEAFEASITGPLERAIVFPQLLTKIFRSASIRKRNEENKDEYIKALAPMEY